MLLSARRVFTNLFLPFGETDPFLLQGFKFALGIGISGLVRPLFTICRMRTIFLRFPHRRNQIARKQNNSKRFGFHEPYADDFSMEGLLAPPSSGIVSVPIFR